MRSRFPILILCGVAWLALGAFGRAAEVSVGAKLSHRVAESGVAVQLQVEISGASGDVNPPDVQVDGLDVKFAFPSSSHRVQIVNGQITNERSTTLVYEVMPKREGDFTIPALQVAVNGRIYKTEPVALKVQKPGAAAGGDAPPSAVAEIEVKRNKVYLGEVIPVEVRLVVDVRMRAQLENAPELNGDGFTVQKFPRFTESRDVRDGHEVAVVSFRSAMTPTKAGKLTIGPCEIPYIGQVARAKRNVRRSLFDQFFDDDFFNPLNSERRRFVAKAEAVELDVKPFPVEGRPKDFTGAVGQFAFDAAGSPSTVKLGEPVTMRLVVSGDGNFDRVQAPALVSADGWKTYDAAEKFEPSNEMRTSGTKTFEMPVVPEAKHREMPQFQFSFFDPQTEKYVTLRSTPAPLVVQGEPLVAPAQPAPATPAPDATPIPRNDIAGIRYEEGRRRTFAPIHTQRGFWVAQGLAALVALGLVSSRWLRPDPAKARGAALRRERDELWSRLRGEEGEFYELAAKVVQVETALVGGVEPGSVDAAVAKRFLQAGDGAAAEIDAIFDARAERLYAGGAVAAAVPSAERERVLRALEGIRRR